MRYSTDSKANLLNVAYRGINLSAAEHGNWLTANNNPINWRWPLEQNYDYLNGYGNRLIRLPYLWERVQPDHYLPNDPTQMAEIEQQLDFAFDHNQVVIIDNHCYGGYKGVKFGAAVGITEFAEHWRQMAAAFKDHPALVGYGLANEVNGIPDADILDGQGVVTGQMRWYQYAQAAINAIRTEDSTTPIMVGGYASSVVDSWLSNTPQLGNKDITEYVTDPSNMLFFEAHIYFDGLGTYPQSYDYYNTNSGQTSGPIDGLWKAKLPQLRAWLDWGVEHGVKLFLGEVGTPRIKTNNNQAQVDKWNVWMDEYLKLVDAYSHIIPVWACIWATGRWSPTYELQYHQNSTVNPDELDHPNENFPPVAKHPTFYVTGPTAANRSVTSARQGLRWRGQNFPIDYATLSGSMVNGQVYATLVPITEPGHLVQVNVAVNTAGVSPVAGQSFVALFDPDTGTQLAVSGDIGSSLTSTGVKNIDLISKTRVFKAGELVVAAIVTNFATPPQLAKSAMNLSYANSRKFGVAATAATAMPAVVNPNSNSAPTQLFWMATSGW